MQDQTLATVIENAAQAGGAILQDVVVSRREQQRMQTRMEHEKEIAQARANASPGSQPQRQQQPPAQEPRERQQPAQGQGGPEYALEPTEPESATDALDDAVEYGENYLDRVEAAINMEDCGFCQNVLQDLRSRPAEEQVRGVRELRTLKREMTTGATPDRDRIEELIRGFEVIELPSLQ